MYVYLCVTERVLCVIFTSVCVCEKKIENVCVKNSDGVCCEKGESVCACETREIRYEFEKKIYCAGVNKR